MLEPLLVIFFGSLIFLAGWIILTGSLQQFLLLTRPPAAAWHIYLWSLLNSLPPLIIPAAVLFKLPGQLGARLAGGIAGGSMLALLTLLPGILALLFILQRRVLLHAPLWSRKSVFSSHDSLMLGIPPLLLLLASGWLPFLHGLGAGFLVWGFLLFLKHGCLGTPPLLPYPRFGSRSWPAAALQSGLACFLLASGSGFIADGCMMGATGGSGQLLFLSMFLVPLLSQLYPGCRMASYVMNGQDDSAGIYLFGHLISSFTILPALITLLGDWMLCWPSRIALAVCSAVLILLVLQARAPTGLTPSLFIRIGLVYPIFFFLLLLLA
ncbi:MAG: hypothetical protein QHH02_01825 [Syntrophomonadaceae bacterium]|nr:hypothetical protein [Syntrophomonadaceae bacterium]